jgi:anti-anti-sigma factor
MTDADLYPEDFSVSVESHGDHDVVRVVGDLDMSTVAQLEEATGSLTASGRTLLIDLGGLSFIDSSGLRYFITLMKASQRDGFVFMIRRPRAEVFRTFQLTALDDVLPWAG